MTSLTDRYLTAVLGGTPRDQRPDVERELRSSIADAIEDRVGAGEDPARAEVQVLEDLGDPAVLSARMSGRPLWIVGPELYLIWRHLMLLLLPVALSVVAVVQAVLAIAREETAGQVILSAAGGVITVGVHLTFWVTLVFAAWERVASASEVRQGLGLPTGRWTVDRLPVPASGRMSASDIVTELLTSILCVVGLVVLAGIRVTVDGVDVPLLAAGFRELWVPVLIGVLVAQALLYVVVYVRGRWTFRLAGINSVLGIAFAAPLTLLALRGQLLDPAFGPAVGVPDLGAADSLLMVILAISFVLVGAWEVIDPFRRTARADAASGHAA